MPDLGRVHRFHDHGIAVVNWRPTRFVDEVPSSFVCGLCRVIPKHILLLPCGHNLCLRCHEASSQDLRCPLDREQFESAECVDYEVPAMRVSTMKVYCWNEAHGCEFEGTVDDMLRHYENECTFHTVECSRCGEEVLHRELSNHYVVACGAIVRSSSTENTSLEPTALTLQEDSAALKSPKTLQRHTDQDHIVHTIQSKVNELTEEIRNQESRLTKITRELGAFVEAEVAGKVEACEPSLKTELPKFTTAISSTTSHNLRSWPSQAEEANTPSSGESMFILRKLEQLASMSLCSLEWLREVSLQKSNPYNVHEEPEVSLVWSGSTRTSSTARGLQEVEDGDRYLLTLNNCGDSRYRGGRTKIAETTMLHRRNAYFTVEVLQCGADLIVDMVFFCMPVGSSSSAPSLDVAVFEADGFYHLPNTRYEPCSSCENIGGSWFHFHVEFKRSIDKRGTYGLHKDKYWIHVAYKENAQPGNSSAHS